MKRRAFIRLLFSAVLPWPVAVRAQIELIINMATAKALGITVPQSILIRADKVVE